jgi:RND family efflux transporter MFP subunit
MKSVHPPGAGRESSTTSRDWGSVHSEGNGGSSHAAHEPESDAGSHAPGHIPTGHAATEEAPPARPLPVRHIAIGLLVVGVLFLAAFAVGTLPKVRTSRALNALSQVDGPPLVQVTHIRRGAAQSSIVLPGTLEPIHQTAIYARTSGYVKQWMVDIGRSVRAGEVLAIIETPDLDAQLAQSKATVEQAKSALDLAKVQEDRWAAMVKDSVVTVDEYDQKRQAAQAAAASLGAAQADERRLQALTDYERVTAPFSGIVTGRNVDVGAFVQSGGGMGAALPSNGSQAPSSLFQVAQTDTVRVYVSVPQTNAVAIQPGQKADVRVREFPNQTFVGEVVRTARAVDPQSRTLLTEIQILNTKHVLLPGMYAQIRFLFDRSSPPLVVPATALLPLTNGIQVAEIDGDQKVRHRTIRISRDYGSYVEADSGIAEGATVVLNPTDALTEGLQVKVEAHPNPSDSGTSAGRAVQVGK